MTKLAIVLICIFSFISCSENIIQQNRCKRFVKNLNEKRKKHLENKNQLFTKSNKSKYYLKCLKTYLKKDINKYYRIARFFIDKKFHKISKSFWGRKVILWSIPLAMKSNKGYLGRFYFLRSLSLLYHLDEKGALKFFIKSVQSYKKFPKFLIKDKNFFVKEIYSPFNDKNRRNLLLLKRRKVSGFGEYRNTYIPGHKHSGVDFKGKYKEKVYAVGNGQVIDIHLNFPFKTVVIAHFDFKRRKIFYTSYKHITQVKVNVGQWVSKQTLLGRLFTKKENLKAGYSINHLHFEIRNSFKDEGSASWTIKKIEELKVFCVDPMIFFKEHLSF